MQQEQQQQQQNLLQATLQLLHAKERNLHRIQNDIAALRRIVKILFPEAVWRASEVNPDRIQAANPVPDPERNRGGPRRRHLGKRERRRLPQRLQQRVQHRPKHVVNLIKTDTKTVAFLSTYRPHPNLHKTQRG